jgi:energy-coupling factor transport system permease protein
MNAVTGFRSFHPLPGFLYYAGVMLMSMLLLHPVYLATAVVCMAALNLISDRPGKMLRIMALFLLLSMALGAINPLFSHRGSHILFQWMDRPVTLEAVLYGLTMALSPLAMMYACMSYQQVVTSDKFLYLFGSLWPKGALIVMMAMRFVPLLYRRLRQISQVQRTKGVSLTGGPLRKRINDGVKVLHILLTWSLEDALQTADSMKARGYGTGPRSAYRPYRMRPRDWSLLVFIAAACLLCVGGRAFGYGLLTIYPRLETLRLHSWEWIHFGVFALYLCTPLLIEGKEWLQWRFYK